MPLITAGLPGAPDADRKAVGFWMIDEETQNQIRVFVTSMALAEFDPSEPWDRDAGIEIFDKNRVRIEAAASNKFDVDGADDGDDYQAQPVLTVRSNDL